MASIKRLIASTAGAALAASAWISQAEGAPEPSPLAPLWYDAQVAELLNNLRDKAPFGTIQIDNVRIVDPATATVTPGSTIIVRGTRIAWAGPSGKAPRFEGAVKIDGHGRFASPGLTDMHIHSGRADGMLLNMAAGVTTVRDMDGFPWMLRMRQQINAGRMLAPTAYVAGTIIAAAPLDGYAVVIANPSDARRVVRQQAACGYEFIKVHNNLPERDLDAIAEQARALGMDLVGHVPHDISLDHALHVDRMRTVEHLKGFLIDQTLLPSDEDYEAALANTQTWITPTLYTRRGYERGDWARGVLAGPLASYAPPEVRARWADLIAHPSERDLTLGPRFRNTQGVVMKRLVPLHPHWLTGTDAEGYAFNVMGFALLDELHLMQSEGVSAPDVFRASTSEAAAAMHETGEFAIIAKGARADILLLDRNPLQDVAAFDHHEGVMVHGHWLDRATVDRSLHDLAAIYADGKPVPGASTEAVRALLARIAKLQADGFVFDDSKLAMLAEALKKSSPALAKAVEALEVAAPGSACYVPPPTD
jgi:hypothetical protein